VDVFFDQLNMCHKVSFVGRLELDFPITTVSDTLLHKMQIVKITQNDLVDVVALLRDHSVGSEDKETINLPYIANVLSADWGFYYTFFQNLVKVETFASS